MLCRPLQPPHPAAFLILEQLKTFFSLSWCVVCCCQSAADNKMPMNPTSQLLFREVSSLLIAEMVMVMVDQTTVDYNTV